MAAPAPDLWTFAARAYATCGDACLALQDSYGVDVTLLLFAAWIGETRGVALNQARLAEADGWIAGWRREVVQPLRGVRRALKGAGAEALRDAVKAAELQSERRALAILEERSAGWAGSGAVPDLSAVFAFATGRAPEPEPARLLAAVAAAARLGAPA